MTVVLEKYDGSDLKSHIESVFNKTGFKPKGKIFIKPNLGGRAPVYKSENTDANFMKELLAVLLERNCEVIIGHTSLVGTPEEAYPFERILNLSNFEQFKTFNGVTLLNLDKVKKKEVKYEQITFIIPEILSEVDSYINLTKLKTHMETGVTLCLKNQMGLLPLDNKVQMHKLDLDRYIAYLGKLIRPAINVIDGIIGMEENGPHHGKDKIANLILCGDDMVEIDSFAAAMIGLDYSLVKHICIAQKAGVGEYVHGSKIRENEDKIVKFIPARRFVLKGKKIHIWPTSACSRCIITLDRAGREIERKLIHKVSLFVRAYLFRTDIVFGNCRGLSVSGMGKCVGIGDCAEEWCKSNKVDYLNGCPPSLSDVKNYLSMKLLGVGK
ncbi:hypothetical protein ES705_31291 [subsurface metagenome]